MVLTRGAASLHEAMRRAAAEACTLRDLGIAFTQALKPLGIDCFAVGHLRGGGRSPTIFFTNWPRAWMEHYAASGFIAEDPVVAAAIQSPAPFTWAELDERGYAGNPVLAAASRFGFHQGFAVPVHEADGRRGVVALAAHQLRMGDADREALVESVPQVHAAARRLFERRAGPPILPPREREALSLVAQGYEDAAIGTALGITRTSAHVYVERAKRRLGATTRAQAVAMAVADGLL